MSPIINPNDEDDGSRIDQTPVDQTPVPVSHSSPKPDNEKIDVLVHDPPTAFENPFFVEGQVPFDNIELKEIVNVVPKVNVDVSNVSLIENQSDSVLIDSSSNVSSLTPVNRPDPDNSGPPANRTRSKSRIGCKFDN